MTLWASGVVPCGTYAGEGGNDLSSDGPEQRVLVDERGDIGVRTSSTDKASPGRIQYLPSG
jgi:hypothetical protein